MTAAQAGEQRGVVAEGILRGRGQLGGAGHGTGGPRDRRCGEQRAGSGCSGSDGDAVQEIAPRDGLIHAE